MTLPDRTTAEYQYRNGRDEDPHAFGLRAARALEAKILELVAANVAAFIGEPIQGAGGVIIPPSSYWTSMTCAKGITSGYVPRSAILLSDAVAETLSEHGDKFYHGFTYSGHPVACAVALANIRLLDEEWMAARAVVAGERLRGGCGCCWTRNRWWAKSAPSG